MLDVLLEGEEKRALSVACFIHDEGTIVSKDHVLCVHNRIVLMGIVHTQEFYVLFIQSLRYIGCC